MDTAQLSFLLEYKDTHAARHDIVGGDSRLKNFFFKELIICIDSQVGVILLLTWAIIHTLLREISFQFRMN